MLMYRDTIYRGAKDRSNLEELESQCCIIIAKTISIPILYLEGNTIRHTMYTHALQH